MDNHGMISGIKLPIFARPWMAETAQNMPPKGTLLTQLAWVKYS